MIHLFRFLSLSTSTSVSEIVLSPPNLFLTSSQQRAPCAVCMWAETAITARHKGSCDWKKTNLRVDRKALLWCVMSNCCNYKIIDVFFFRFLLYIPMIPAAVLRAYLPSSPARVYSSAHPSLLSLHHLCHCQSPGRAYKAAELWSAFICQERHWTWPVIKPWQRMC